MSQLFREAAQSLSPLAVLWMGGTSVAFTALFLAWVAWAYAPSRAEEMEQLGHLPLDDGA